MKANRIESLCLFMLFHCSFLGQGLCNNIQVSEVSTQSQNLAQGFTMVCFDLSWENSWRTQLPPVNHDAAWVFIKYRSVGEPWQHATLNHVDGTAIGDGHVQPLGATIKTSPDGKGVFVYKSAAGEGHNHWNIQLRWNYGVDGIQGNQTVEIKVMAIEMVYVPEGSFTIGGGNGGEIGKIFAWNGPFNYGNGFDINSEASISVGTSPGSIYYLSPATWDAGDQLGPIPASFPKGYHGFYCMKYEVTQEQWIDFFNALEPDQQTQNDITDLDHRGPNPIDRNSIEWEGTGGATTVNPNTPLSFPLWGEVLSYLDWTALRPMTELEFVKACRGPANPVPEGYAWGNNKIIAEQFTYDLINENEADELLVNHVQGIGNANWIHSAIFEDGPYRSGIFAASSASNSRQESGASYYGIMELSGNLSEMAVTMGTPEGRSFTGLHGDGVLDGNGEADVANWPPITGEGGGLFGGSWFSHPEELMINERRSATIGNVGYFNDVGFRGVRTAP